MQGITPQNYDAVQLLWDYMKLNQQHEVVDVLIVPGSSDDSYISKVLQLYSQGYAKHIICSGHGSHYVDKGYTETEAEHFSKLLVGQGIPHEAIILEPLAINCGENIRLCYQICRDHDRDSVLIVQKPFMERRFYATALYESYEGWRPSRILVGSSDVTIEQYDLINTLPMPWVQMLVGDLHRIKVCNDQGRITYQEIPLEVTDAYYALIEQGYDQLLAKGYPIR